MLYTCSVVSLELEMENVYSSILFMDAIWATGICILVIIASALSLYILPWRDAELVAIDREVSNKWRNIKGMRPTLAENIHCSVVDT